MTGPDRTGLSPAGRRGYAPAQGQDEEITIMNSVRHTLAGLAVAALAVSVAAAPADARAKRKHKAAPVAAATTAAPSATPSETPEQQRVRLNAEQAAKAKAQNDQNVANKAAHDAAIAQQKADADAARAKWLAETVPCKDDPEVRCAKPAAK
ncbi:MAG: hypothetical protein ACKOVA_01150 [Novosphingobium sp.]